MRNKPIFAMSPEMERVARQARNNADPKKAVDELMRSFEDFKDANDESLKRRDDAIHERIDRLETILNRPDLGGGRGGGSPAQNAELNKAFRHYLKTDDMSRLNTISTVSDPDGGYLILPERSTGMTKKIFDLSPIRRLAREVTLTQSGTFEEPIDKDDIEGSWVGELGSRNEGTTPQFGLLSVEAKESYALVPITQKMIDDYPDIFGWSEGKIANKFARMEGTAFVSGTGDPSSEPKGFLTYPVAATGDSARAWATLQYVVSGADTTITGDSLIDLVYSLRAPYRTGATWLMSSDTARIVSKLKDGNGDYLWRESLASGVPNSLCGFPVSYSEDMPAVGAGNYPIAFANWKSAYVIVDRLGIRFLRDPFSSKPKVLLYAYRRTGGAVANSEAIKLMKIGQS